MKWRDLLGTREEEWNLIFSIKFLFPPGSTFFLLLKPAKESHSFKGYRGGLEQETQEEE